MPAIFSAAADGKKQLHHHFNSGTRFSGYDLERSARQTEE